MKTPRFFCENCNREVPARAKVCPHCGRFFSDVRCPRCGHSGAVKDFFSGCRRCGFLDPDWRTAGGQDSGRSTDTDVVDPHEVGLPPEKRPRPLRLNGMAALLGLLLLAILYIYGLILRP